MDRADESLFICVTIDERRFCFNFSAAPSAFNWRGFFRIFDFASFWVSVCVVVSCYTWNTGGGLRDFAEKNGWMTIEMFLANQLEFLTPEFFLGGGRDPFI